MPFSTNIENGGEEKPHEMCFVVPDSKRGTYVYMNKFYFSIEQLSREYDGKYGKSKQFRET